MDEPLSNLDAKLRVQMRAEIARIQTRPRRHDHLRHPRPGRGDDDGRPRRRDAQGRAAAGRPPADALRAPGQHLRRRVHRLSGDEPVRRHAAAATASASPSSSVASGCRCRTRCWPRGPLCGVTRTRRSCSASAPRTWRTPRSCPTRPPSAASVDRRAARSARLRRRRALHRSTRPGDDRGRRGARRRRRARSARASARSRPQGGRSTVLARLNPRTTVRKGEPIELVVDTAPPALLRSRRRARASTATPIRASPNS